MEAADLDANETYDDHYQNISNVSSSLASAQTLSPLSSEKCSALSEREVSREDSERRRKRR